MTLNVGRYNAPIRRAVILILAMSAAVEGSSFAALFLLAKVRHIAYAPISTHSLSKSARETIEDLLGGKTGYVIYSSTLGWTIKPNGVSAPLYRANSQGIRATREYALTPPEKVLRISTFGDSFTHGDDVRNADTWQEALMRAQRNTEVLNFGVGAFGLDQAFLRYQQDGAAYKPHIVLIGFQSENINRSVNVFRPFYLSRGSFALAKPRYVLDAGRLVLLPNPMEDLSQYRDLLTNPERVIPKLGAHDYFFHSRDREGPFDFLASVRLFRLGRSRLMDRVGRGTGIERNSRYNTDSEAFKVTAAIFDQFVGTVSQNGSVPVIVVMPNGGDVERYRRDRTKLYAPLLDYLRGKGYRYLDVLDGFETYGREMTAHELVPYHYSPAGNRLVAKIILRYLADNRLSDPKTFNAASRAGRDRLSVR